MTEHVVVVAAVIEQHGSFLVSRRLSGTHLAGYWEFPGGKVHEGEAHEDALRREVAEELNTGITRLRKIFQTSHSYPERVVDLYFYRGSLIGRPEPALGQELRWVTREDFDRLAFPPADAELIAGLVGGRLSNGASLG